MRGKSGSSDGTLFVHAGGTQRVTDEEPRSVSLMFWASCVDFVQPRKMLNVECWQSGVEVLLWRRHLESKGLVRIEELPQRLAAVEEG